MVVLTFLVLLLSGVYWLGKSEIFMPVKGIYISGWPARFVAIVWIGYMVACMWVFSRGKRPSDSMEANEPPDKGANRR
jgi:hypothetical protein